MREGQLGNEADARVMHEGSCRRRWANSHSCSESPFPPDATGLKSGTPAQPEAQFHASVAAGGQYAALAKKASGAKASICAWERVVIDWRAESGDGAARTRVARAVRTRLRRTERGDSIVVCQVCGGPGEKAGRTQRNTTSAS